MSNQEKQGILQKLDKDKLRDSRDSDSFDDDRENQYNNQQDYIKDQEQNSQQGQQNDINQQAQQQFDSGSKYSNDQNFIKQQQNQEELENVKKDQNQNNQKCQKCVIDQELLDQRLEVSEKLEKQNEKLSKDIQELKRVKADLEKQAEKKKLEKEQQQKKKEKQQEQQSNGKMDDNKKEIAKLQKEIEDMHTKFSVLKSEVQKFQKTIDNDQNFEKARVLLNQQDQIEKEIENVKAENKNLDKERRENEYEIQLRNADFVEQQRNLKEKLKELKDEHIQIRNKNRDFKIQMLVQQEYLVRLEQQHRDICETFGVSSSLVQTRIDNITKLLVQNHERKLVQQEKEEAEEQKLSEKGLDEQKYLENRQKIIDLMNQKRKEMNEGDEQLKNLETQLQLAERELQVTQMKFKEKDHELNIVLQKINELKKQTKHNQLQPMNLESNVFLSPNLRNSAKTNNLITNQSSNYSNINRNRNSLSVQKTSNSRNQLSKINLKSFVSANQNKYDPVQMVRIVQGGCQINNNINNYLTINDNDQIQNSSQNKDYKISEVEFFYLDHVILGLKVKYKMGPKKEIVQVDSFLPKNVQLKYLLSTSYTFSDMEYIQKVSGYHNNTSITYLELVTSRSGVFTVGTNKKGSKNRFFQLDLQEDEKPISFQLVIKKIDEQSDDNNQQQYLVKLGLECKRKNNFNIKSLGYGSNKNLNKRKNQNKSFQDIENIGKLGNNNVNNISQIPVKNINSQNSLSRDITPKYSGDQIQKSQPSNNNKNEEKQKKKQDFPNLRYKETENQVENQLLNLNGKNQSSQNNDQEKELQKFLDD
ncbi:Mannose-binding lectin [Pseudocohnilembus persalinus]|uniref:Mannose-binding lectin n=1 Tax=Pseudocohnilembus persalinus TaxID=266149 RepID=A0A0V0QQW0_PSEPJ|nr:Mannose-binding lectin [Pseudocohnilembus persalinus]|eukprot:KRX04665.1 Mannose-binding lectin [Pseudocohnilembus persalinus]